VQVRIIPWKLPRVRAAAAAGITALAAGLVLFLVQREPVPVESRGPDPTASRGVANPAPAIQSVSKEEQPGSDAVLRWTPIDRALRYRVQVSTEDLRPVYDRTVEATTLTLPPTVVDVGKQAPLLLWQVEAMLPDGQTVTSPTFRVRLVAPSP